MPEAPKEILVLAAGVCVKIVPPKPDEYGGDYGENPPGFRAFGNDFSLFPAFWRLRGQQFVQSL